MDVIKVDNESLVLRDNVYIIDKPFNDLKISIFRNTHAKLVVNENIARLFINLEEYSTLDIDFISNDNDSQIKSNVSLGASFNLNVIGSSKMNHDINVSLDGANASCKVKVLSIASDQNINFNTKIIHNAKNTKSQVENYGIGIKNSSIVFNTTGKIEKGMSKSECRQITRGIISGDKSAIKALPILLIDEYDVSANHGAAIGKMSDDELFYLMSRGLSKNEALKLILSGIINPFLDNLIMSEFKEELEQKIFSKM